jgi:pyruvate/2-oxoglutarate dehydrogenase complex dihydrolipoamide acyltransferase (E2) component
MADVLFPQMSQNEPDAEGVVSVWFVSDGDQVEEGDLVAEVAVDKADMEIVAPQTGTISLLVAQDQAVKQNTPIATIF